MENEMRDDDPRRLKFVMFKGYIVLGFVVLRNLKAILNLGREMRKAKHVKYERPPRRYRIPEYKEGMKVCETDEKYLRPTPYCNYRVPEIIALANHLGAFKKSDYEYAKAAFDFVKRNVILEFLPMDDVRDTLLRGTGTCIHKISLFIALCRAAGIKARYKLYAPIMTEAWYDHLIGADPLAQQWYNAMGYFLLHGEGEAYIDGKWVVADVGPTPERQAAQGIPITKFGEDSIGTWFYAVPGTITRVESITSIGFGRKLTRPFLKLFMERIAKVPLARLNQSILEQIERGKKIIEEAGGEEEYDRKARKRYRPVALEPHLMEKTEKLKFRR